MNNRAYFALPWTLVLIVGSSMLVLAACSDDIDSTPVATATPDSTPVATATPVSQDNIVAQLTKNAEEFEYAIGI